MNFDVVTDEYMRDSGITRDGNRRLSVCRVLGQIYVNTDDEEVKLKLRYASTLVRHLIYKLREYDPEWVRDFVPLYKDYDTLMRDK